MHDDRVLVEERLRRAQDERIRPALYGPSLALDVQAWTAPDEPVPVIEGLAAAYEPFAVGSAWGAPWSTTWFHLRGQIPAEWAGQRVEVVVDLSFDPSSPGFQAEGLAYTPAGEPIKGIAPRNNYLPIANPARGGEPIDVFVEAAANPRIADAHGRPTEMGDKLTAPREPLYRLARADAAVLREDVWGLLLDIEVLSELMAELSEHEPRRHEILRALERMLDALDLADVPETAAPARAELAEVLAKPANASAHRISAAGHAHIDSAWLWPQRETIRKSARTFANVAALATEYPELVFACSQAQQYAWVRDHRPKVFARVRESIRAGNFAPVGSMWVEADANLPGGEALARQIVHGKRFFADELGVDTRGIWLPDSFGYNGAFPQIARLAGLEWFLTQKISWNQTNRMPHHTFWWEGIDGTRIFTHFPPADTYNGTFSGVELAHASRNYAEKGVGTISLLPFGYGDGGGGPTREMMEKARRLADLEGSPRVRIEHPDAFFAAARDEYPDAPVWSGEMYLELHRGTYTSQAKTKQGNRRSEHLLRELELWAATAAVAGAADYPYDEIDRLWKTVLLHQFHDILPGSSIAWVHREARETYARIGGEMEDLISSAADSFGDGPGGIQILNAAPQTRAEVTAVPLELAASTEVTQKLADGRVAVWATAPALGVGAASPDLPGDQAPVAVTARSLDNGLLRVGIDGNGLITSLYDLAADREVLPPGGRGNLLQLHPDVPNRWDAWDIDRHYLRRHTDLTAADSVEVLDGGPLHGSVQVRRSLPTGTRITQTLILRAGSRRLDIETEIDWRESEKVLKAAFPLDVHAERETVEIQFGHVHRPTHTNTSWDWARFERYHHRWIHLGEPGYGVAVLNDSTYGHDARRDTRESGGTTTTVRLTLLRAPHNPDPRTDVDTHRFTYSIRPGAEIADAIAEGYCVNLPLRGVANAAPAPIVAVDNPRLTVEAVKLADDRSGDVVVRLYASGGGRAAGSLTAGFDVSSAQVVDLLERPLSDLVISGRSIRLALRPFQIITVRLAR